MKDRHIAKVMDVWASKNKIENPNTKVKFLEVVDHIASLFSPGDYFYFIFSFETLEMQLVSPNIKDVLGIEPEVFSLDYLFLIMHPEDTSKIHEKENVCLDFLFNHISIEDIPMYKVIYLMRLKHLNGDYKTILHQSRAINVSKGGKIQQVLCIYTDLTYLNPPMDHKISFISAERPSYYAIETTNRYSFIENNSLKIYSKREIQILDEIAQGKSFVEIAEILHISPHTVNTHKKNILKKSKCKNTAELIAKCIREGII